MFYGDCTRVFADTATSDEEGDGSGGEDTDGLRNTNEGAPLDDYSNHCYEQQRTAATIV